MQREGKLVLTAEDRTAQAFDSVQRRLAGVSRNMALAAAGAAAATAGVGVMITRRAMTDIDELAKQADRLDANIEKLAAYKVAADLAGVGGEAFAASLQRQVQNIGAARDGTGEAAAALKQLSLNVNELAGMRADQQFEAIAAAIAKLPSQVDKANAAARIWGARDGARMLSLIEEMGPETEALTRHLDAIGVTLSRIDAGKVEAANDALELAGKAAQGFGNTMAVAISPFVEEAAKNLSEAAEAAGGFKVAVEHGMMAAAASVGVAADVIRGIEVELKTLEVIAYGAAAATNLILSPFLQPEIVDATLDSLRAAREELEALVNAPMPSEAVRDRFFEIREAAENAAATAAHGKGKGGAGGIIQPLDNAKAAKDAAALEKILGDLYERNAELITGKSKATLDYEARLTDINELFARGLIPNQEEYNAAVERLDKSYAKASAGASVFADQAARNIQSITANLFSAAAAGQNMGDVIVDSLQRIAAELAAQQALQALFGAFAGSDIDLLADIGQAGLKGIGGRAAGGPVSANDPYIVGERGPELFVPRMAGYVVPNMLGATSKVVNLNVAYNVNATGGTSAAQVVALHQMFRENNRQLLNHIQEMRLRGNL